MSDRDPDVQSRGAVRVPAPGCAGAASIYNDFFYLHLEPGSDRLMCVGQSPPSCRRDVLAMGAIEITEATFHRVRTTTVPLRLVDNTLAEIAPAAPTEYELRAQRGALLTQSDWMVQPDVPVSDDLKARRLAYRQALRDIPEQPGWPNAVLWPDLPS